MTISSMTAFAHRRSEHPWGTAIWELRSVNHRYLELSFKLPEGWRQLEPELRDRLRSALQRGKVECSLRLSLQGQDQQLQLNRPLAQQLLDTAHQLRADIAHAAPIDAMDIMRWPGVIQSAELDGDSVSHDLLAAFADALDDQCAHRQREGDELAALIEQRLRTRWMTNESVAARLPEIEAAVRDGNRTPTLGAADILEIALKDMP